MRALAAGAAVALVLLGQAAPAYAGGDPPVAFDDEITVSTGDSTSVSLFASDNEDDPLTYAIVVGPAHGSLTGDCADGNCTYTPTGAFTGADSFTWKANDGTSDSNTATVSVTVLAQLPPEAFDDSVSVVANTSESIFLSADDPNGDPLTYTVVTPPAHGNLTDDCTDADCTYTPTVGYVGPDSFTFKANDGTADSNVATMSIEVMAPPSVEQLQVSGAGSGRATLTWQNVAGVDEIIVRYATDDFPATPASGTGVPVVGTPTTVTVSGLVDGTEYFFSVFAVVDGLQHEASTITFTPFSCPDLTTALDAAGLVTGQSWVACSSANAHEPASTLTTLLPKTGVTQSLMTSGTKTVAIPPSDGGSEGAGTGTGSRGAFDVSIYKIDVNVPALATCLQFDYVFASEEYPEYVGSEFNDGFIAQLDQNAWSVSEASVITATGNFAKLADDSIISVNGPIFADPTKVAGPDTNGTGYDGMGVALTASTPITPGAHSIYLSIFDAGDSAYDSAAFLDNLRTGTGACTAGSNQPPNAVNDTTTTPEDTAKAVTVLANDTDGDGHTLTVTGKTNGLHGTVVCSATSCTYTPDLNYNGSDSFTYTVSDGNGGTDTATVTVTVTPVNDPPVAVDDALSTNQGTPSAPLSVLANDTDVDGGALSVTGKTDGAHGTVVCSATTCTYTPAPGYSGPDSFTYTVSDGNGGTDVGTVTVTVVPTGPNQPPVANDDSTTTAEDTAKAIAVLANDTDSDGGTLSITGKTDGANGTVLCTATSCTYTPALNYVGPDSFTYTISDGQGGSDTATVTVTVTAVNDAPVAVNDGVTTAEETPSAPVSVLTNDTDIDGGALAVTGKTNGVYGTVVCTATTCTYTPVLNYVGPDSFTYTVSDGNGGTDVGTVNVTVTPVDDPPDAINDTASTTQNVAVAVAVLANDVEVDGEALAITAKTNGTHGLVTCTVTCVYTPDTGFIGTDSFTYTISDGHSTDTATVTVTVAGGDVTVTKSSLVPSLKVGTLGGYQIVVKNLGTTTSSPVTLTDQLPSGFVVQQVTGTGCSVAAGQLTCALGTLPGGGSVTVQVAGAFTVAGTIGNTASVTTANDTNPGNNTSSVNTTVTGQSCTIVGTFGNDRIKGTGKADVICGLAGHDRIQGKSGNDVIYGNEGDDRIDGGIGNDLIDGGPGIDAVSFASSQQGVSANLGKKKAVGQGKDTLVDLENMVGSSYKDTLIGDSKPNKIDGGGGNDTIKGKGGKDKLSQGPGTGPVIQ